MEIPSVFSLQIQVATMLGEGIVLRSLEQFVDILSNFAEEIKGRF